MADTFVLLDTLPPQFFKVDANGNGVPLSGGTLESFAAGTTTPQNVYDADGNALGTVLNLDSRGEIMTVKNVWLKVGDNYKFRLKDADGVEIWTVDDISTDQGIRTFSDQITINVPSAKAPFVLNALAQGQLVTGLNADSVDGADVGTNNGDIVLKENLSSAASAATESAQGVAEIATQAEVDAGTDDARFITPLKLTNFADLLSASDKDLSSDGYQVFPSGLVIQWGSANGNDGVVFPVAFASETFVVHCTPDDQPDKMPYATDITRFGFTAKSWDSSSQAHQTSALFWLAIGK